ncbi:MAG TPA: hypothetical protein VFK10_08865 [Burkholderiaceae bacterium]|nr:hypothetical protein [Burkholderiaceae bacterium]
MVTAATRLIPVAAPSHKVAAEALISEYLQWVAGVARVILLPKELRGSPYDYDAALRASVGNKAEAVLIFSSGAFFPGRFTLMSAIQKHRLPPHGFRPVSGCRGDALLRRELYAHVRAGSRIRRPHSQGP